MNTISYKDYQPFTDEELEGGLSGPQPLFGLSTAMTLFLGRLTATVTRLAQERNRALVEVAQLRHLLTRSALSKSDMVVEIGQLRAQVKEMETARAESAGRRDGT